ncbi:MAG: hypothetical protein ACPGO3_12220 [Magnetospiraceae bacterium]
MKARFIGLLVISGTFFLVMSFMYGFSGQGMAFAGAIAGSIFMAGVTVGPLLIFVERKLSRALAGVIAIAGFPTVTFFFFRIFSSWAAP